MSNCKHGTIMRGMCCDCGLVFSEFDQLNFPPQDAASILHGIPDLLVSREEAQIIGRKDQEILLKSKKLVLIVDLDHTLVHSRLLRNTPGNGGGGPLGRLHHNDGAEVYHIYTEGAHMEVCVRPGTRDFLCSLTSKYEVHVFTLGTRDYAHSIVQIIDPDASIVCDRVRSRSECALSTSKHSEISKIFPVGDSMVCILDDRLDVWGSCQNVIQVLPFYHFPLDLEVNASPVFTDHFNLASVEKIAQISGLRPYFDYLRERLERLHSCYFAALSHTLGQEDSLWESFQLGSLDKCLNNKGEVDVNRILTQMNLQVLKGVRLVFSGIISLNIKLRDTREFKLASSLGAVVTDELEPGFTTHVVSNGMRTAKVVYALGHREQVRLVHLDWLYSCYYFGFHLSEEIFRIPVLLEQGQNPPPKSVVDSLGKNDYEEDVMIPTEDDNGRAQPPASSSQGVSVPDDFNKFLISQNKRKRGSSKSLDQYDDCPFSNNPPSKCFRGIQESTFLMEDETLREVFDSLDDKGNRQEGERDDDSQEADDDEPPPLDSDDHCGGGNNDDYIFVKITEPPICAAGQEQSSKIPTDSDSGHSQTISLSEEEIKEMAKELDSYFDFRD